MEIRELVGALGPRRYLEGVEAVERQLAKTYAEEIRQASINIARSPQTMRVVEAFDESLKVQWETIEGGGMVDLFIEELEKVATIERHGDNLYHILWRNPEAPHAADELVTLQTIPVEAEENGEHRHLEQNRTEVIRVLKGKLYVVVRSVFDRTTISNELILVPGGSVVIDPRQYHSVKNIGDEPVRSLILGAQAA